MIKNTDKFKGKIIHSRMYRNPEEFSKNLKTKMFASWVLLQVGKIFLLKQQLCVRNVMWLARSVHMDPNGKSPYGPNQNIYKVYGTIDDVNENGVHVAADKQNYWLSNIDMLVLCTGYHYDFPFLENSNLPDLE